MTTDDSKHAPGPWHEVQGQSADGTWHALYHLDSSSEAKRTLSMVIESDDEMYDRWEDFRIASPTEKATRRHERRKGKRDVWVA